ncbi:MAG: efflux RND transporter periplasmic adaptor subunit [Steroidobacteraceae bacterium]
MANEEFAKRRRRVRLIWGIAALVLAALVAWGLLPRPVEADFARVDRGPVRVELVDEGRTRMHDTYVISAPISGRVLRVEVEPGDAVAAGAVVARMTRAPAGFLDPRTDLSARATVDAAAAQLRSAETALDLARREHDRTRSLAQQKLVSAAAVDESRARLQAAQASRDAAEAELARARSALQPADRTVPGAVAVRAPVAGRVLRVPQKSENVVTAGSPLIEIGDPSHVEVVAEFLSQDAVRMRPGQRAFIENWGGAPLAAKVDRVEPVAHMKVSALGVEEQRTNVILQFDAAAAAQRLGHDYRVDARVVVDEQADAVRVPLGALFRHGDGWATYRVVDGHAVLTPLTTGIADDRNRVVTQGVAAGDTVVMFPGNAVSDGQSVAPRKAD